MLTVSRDPGVPIVYFSFTLIVLGIAWYVRGPGRRRKPSNHGSSGDTATEKTGRHSA